MRIGRRAAILLLAGAMASSGCLGLPGGAHGATDFATFLDLLPIASDHAPEADLVGVFGLEVSDPDTLADGLPAWLDPFLVDDPKPGDGRAAAWGFVFGAGGADGGHGHDGAGAHLVVVAADGTVVADDLPPRFPVIPDGPLDVGGLADSPQVLAAAAAEPAFDEWTGGYVVATLAGTFPSTWIVQGGSTGDAAHGAVGVTPDDARLVRAGTRDPWAPVPTEAGDVSGTVGAGSPSVHDFTVEHAGHKQLEFVIVDAGSSPLEFAVTGPDGDAHGFHWDGSGGTQQRWFDVPAAPPGAWSVEVTGDGEPADYVVHWCALGAERCP